MTRKMTIMKNMMTQLIGMINETTLRHGVAIGSCPTALRLVVTLLLMMVVLGVSEAWGQQMTNFEGVWYIASNGNAYEAGTTTNLPYTYGSSSNSFSTNFYLRPAADPQIANKTDAFFDGTTENKPFLTSNYTGHTDIALWILEKTNISYTITTPSSGVDYYYTIRHVETGKYLVCDPYFASAGTLGERNDSRRKAMHLETKDWTTTIPDKALFKIRYTLDEKNSGTDTFDSYCFIPKRVENKDYKYLNLADRNQPVNYGTKADLYYGGLAGLYTLEKGIVDINSRFKFESYVVEQPTITFNNATNEVTITATEGSIYYTTNGDTPTSVLTAHTSSVTFTQATPCTIRAIAVKSWNSGVEISSEETSYNLQKVATPTITINADNSVTITCSTTDATIYYKLGGDVPTTANGTQSTSIANILPSQGPIKALAVKDGWIHSTIAEESTIPAKTIAVSSSNGSLTSTDPIVYNGTAQQPAFTIKDGEMTIVSDEYTAVYSDNTNAGTATITITDKEDGDYDVSGSFTFTITQKALTITADSDTKEYDGTALSNSGYTNTELASGDEIKSVTVTGSQTDRGESDNVPSAAIIKNNNGEGDDVMTCYDITYVNGTLRVTGRLITITAGSDTKVYDGTALTNDSYTYDNTKLYSGDAITSVTVTGSQTVAGSSNNVPSAAVIMNGETDRTANYDFNYVNGTLEVTQKALTITADNETKVYDGTALTKNTYTNTDLAMGDNIESVSVTGSQTDAGSSNNVPSAVVIKNNADNNVTSSYDITYMNGTLTVNKKPVGIIWGVTTFTYNGSAQAPTASVTPADLVNSDDVSVSVTGQGTNVGDYTAEATGFNGTKAGNYEFSTSAEVEKTFTITPKSLGNTTDPEENITIEITDADHVSVKQGGKELRVGTEGTDYDYSISTTGGASDKYFVVTVTGANNYTGSFTTKFANVTFGTKNNNYYWGTFVSNSSDGDFAVPSNMEAYIVTGINASAGTVVVEGPLDNIPEQEPVLLLTNKNAHGFIVKAKNDGADPTGNLLEEADADMSVTAAQIYVLYKGEFVLSAAGTLPAGKIYLPKSTGAPAPAILTIDWGATSGIEEIPFSMADAPLSGTWYTLEGIKLNGRPTKKGLYLRDGKKTVVK